MDRLAGALAPGDRGPRLLVKRDDLTGLALGGNKARKLEYLCAEALGEGCDTLVTGGGPQSNHVRMTAAAANRLGLECHLALAPRVTARHTPRPSGNLLLDDLLGATLHFTRTGRLLRDRGRHRRRSRRSSPRTVAPRSRSPSAARR